jgi:DNA-binding response OmpR family regulator
VLRRARMPRQEVASAELSDGNLRLQMSARQACLNGAELPLTTREFDLLAFFLAHPGTVFSRAGLLAKVWGWDFGDQSTVTVHVRRLREKIEREPAKPVRVATVWGVGYRYDLGQS